MKFNNRNVHIAPSAVIGKNVRIGDNTTIYDNVVIGDNAVICDNCVIGEPLNSYYFSEDYRQPTTIIGNGALIRSHAIIYAGSEFGDNFTTGHRVTIRENTRAGRNFSVGTLSDIQGNCVFGDYCRLHSNVHIGQGSRLGNFVFLYPFVVLANDPHPPSNICEGAVIGDYAQIGTHAVILSGVKVGRECVVAANATLTRDLPEQSLAAGNPAKVLSSVREVRSREKPGEMHYPWMLRFERGMPWEGIGYDTWLEQQQDKP